MEIAGRRIGPGHPAFIIAEVAQAHDGSLGLAHAFIDAAADAGADAVKFQTHIAAAESTLDEPFRVKFSLQDARRYDYWRRMEFTPEQWMGLADHARSRKLIFLSSPFSCEAVDLLSSVGMPAWKLASGELGSAAILERMLQHGAPFLISSGMSGWSELDDVVKLVSGRGREHCVLQCTSRYPTPLSQIGLNVIDQMRRRYQVPVGLSDHSGRIEPAMAAIARGADIIELHITLDRRMFGPDVVASLTVQELSQVATFRTAVFEMDSNPVDKDAQANDLSSVRRLFGRSLAPHRDLVEGTIIEHSMLIAKKPGTGIPESRLPELVGRRLKRNVPADRLLTWDDIEDN